MEFLYNILSFLAIILVGLFVFAMIKPGKFRRFVGHYATRKRLALGFVVLLIVCGAALSATEPESYKLARLEAEKQKQEQKMKDEEAKRQTDLATEEEAKNKAQNSSIGEAVEQEPTNPRDYWHKVVRVVDGDTVRALVDGKEEAIRVIGIDAPESTTTTECFGVNASNKAKEFLEGKWIQLERDSSQDTRDKYGRFLAYIWFDAGTDFGRRMIEEGYAHEYTYSVPYSKQAQYKSTYELAKSKQVGLWSTSTCSGQKQQPAISTPSPAPTPKPTPTPAPAPTTSTCDPNYTGGCVPIVSYDLNCPQIGFMVRVVGVDKHNFDGNKDGYGCESYQ